MRRSATLPPAQRVAAIDRAGRGDGHQIEQLLRPPHHQPPYQPHVCPLAGVPIERQRVREHLCRTVAPPDRVLLGRQTRNQRWRRPSRRFVVSLYRTVISLRYKPPGGLIGLNRILIHCCYNYTMPPRLRFDRRRNSTGGECYRRGTMNSQRRLSLLIALALAGILVSCAPSAPATLGSGAPSAPVAATGAPNGPATTGALPDFKHVFVIVLENEDYEDVIGNSKAPYINSLAKHYGLATNYYGIHHPSLPNYLALTGGSTFEISSDCTDCFVAQPNIVDQLEAHGKSWKAYMEGMPGPCFVGDAAPLYRQKHNPFIYYDSVRTNPARCARIVPFTQFETDLQAAALPDYVWITPNMCNDGHDCPS